MRRERSPRVPYRAATPAANPVRCLGSQWAAAASDAWYLRATKIRPWCEDYSSRSEVGGGERSSIDDQRNDSGLKKDQATPKSGNLTSVLKNTSSSVRQPSLRLVIVNLNPPHLSPIPAIHPGNSKASLSSQSSFKNKSSRSLTESSSQSASQPLFAKPLADDTNELWVLSLPAEGFKLVRGDWDPRIKCTVQVNLSSHIGFKSMRMSLFQYFRRFQFLYSSSVFSLPEPSGGFPTTGRDFVGRFGTGKVMHESSPAVECDSSPGPRSFPIADIRHHCFWETIF